jgi:hypothetical protein
MTILDDGETIGLFEPLMVSEGSPQRAGLNDLALDLAEKSAALRSGLPASIAEALADLVRAMNCYYSNLIEGHDTHPIDIERAMRNDYSTDPKKRNLQLEAKAHVAVQKWIDEDGMVKSPTEQASIIELHHRFCDLLPPELLFVENPKTGEKIPVVPGELRTRYVEVGRHRAFSNGCKRPTAYLAGSSQSSQPPVPITGFSGCILSSTVTGALHASCPTPCCARHSIREASGQ